MSYLAGEQDTRTRTRTIEVELSDDDIIKLARKAGAYDITIAELIASFVGDLVGGSHYNGSDESDLARQWYDRCWFSIYPDLTFLKYLIEWEDIDDVLALYDDIQSGKDDIAYYEAHQEETEPDELEAIKEDINYWQEQIDGYWQEYMQQEKKYTPGTFDEEMKKVLSWRDEYKNIIESQPTLIL